jgi:hypothetical protein
VKRGIAAAAVATYVAICVAGCKTPSRPEPSAPVPTSVETLTAAIAADSARTERETDAKVREQLADDARRNGDACMALAPHSAACLYYQGIALGLEARAHPTRASELLKSMLDALGGADAVDPTYDQAGPSRVRALVLTRAPGWPLGPGDLDAAVVAARKAVALRPQYPPNVLALAEALTKSGDADGARDSYVRAHELALSLPPGIDRDEWLRDAEQGLRRK